MANVAQCVSEQVEAIRVRSELAWETAVETAGAGYDGGSDEREEAMGDLAEQCDAAYRDAIRALDSGDVAAAVESLESAKSLEDEGGDSSHASEALELLDGLSSVDGGAVQVYVANTYSGIEDSDRGSTIVQGMIYMRDDADGWQASLDEWVSRRVVEVAS